MKARDAVAFDPFDERFRDPRRAKNGTVGARKRLYESSMHEMLQSVMEQVGWPVCTNSEEIFAWCYMYADVGERTHNMRRNIRKYMGMIGYKCLENKNSLDGRWSISGRNVLLFVNERRSLVKEEDNCTEIVDSASGNVEFRAFKSGRKWLIDVWRE